MIDLCPRDAGLDAYHGVCDKQCENHVVEGKIKTNCTLSLLEAAGLTTSRACGDSLTRSAVLQYMGAWDMEPREMGMNYQSLLWGLQARSGGGTFTWWLALQ